MEVPCQCLSSLPIRHPAVVLSILSSDLLCLTEQEKKVGEAGEEVASTSVKEGVLHLLEQVVKESNTSF